MASGTPDVAVFADRSGMHTVYLPTENNALLARKGEKQWLSLSNCQKITVVIGVIALVSTIMWFTCATERCFSTDQDETTKGMCDHRCPLEIKIITIVLSIISTIGLCCACPIACKKNE